MLSKHRVRNAVLEYIKRLPINVSKAIVFGSSARGTRLMESDIDLIVVSDDFQSMSLQERLELLYRHWDLPVYLEVIPYTESEFEKKRKVSIVVREALKHGFRVK